MTKENIIRMAREAGWKDLRDYDSAMHNEFFMGSTNDLIAFAALVAAAEAEKYKWDIHSCGPTCTKVACVAMREAVAAEREACAKVCESEWSNVAERMYGEECAATIRARSNT
jgi:hypothetical protein